MVTQEERNLIELVEKANNMARAIERILLPYNGCYSSMTLTDKYRLKERAQLYIIHLNDISQIVEPRLSLMTSMVPSVSGGQMPLGSWMMWAMNWFDNFERKFKPMLDQIV